MATLAIWGGFDDLPSIDPECITVLAHLIHQDELENFRISSSFDVSTSSTGDLPLLSTDGTRYAGYNSIAHHLRDPSRSHTSPTTQADTQAWSSFIQTRGQALLDLYLYVSSTNYWNATSPAFTKILPWHSNYLIPPAKRAAAIARTKHLGIRSLDLDRIDEYAAGDDVRIAGQPTTGTSFAQTSNPEELIKKQKSAKWLQSQQRSDTFQLFQLTKAFFGPLQELLGDKKYLLSDDEPTTVDFVAVGFLSLMRYAEVPQPWLSDALRTRFPKLNAYTERLYKQTFMNPQKPWRTHISTASAPSALQATKAMGQGVLEWAVPSFRTSITPDSTVDSSAYCKQTSSDSSSLLGTIFSPTVLLPVGALAAAAIGIARYISIPHESEFDEFGRRRSSETTFKARENDFMSPTRLDDLGESGAMLSALGGIFDQDSQAEKERTGGAPVAEVDVDVQNKEGEVVRDVVYKK